jgi:predicted transcriptional regulator
LLIVYPVINPLSYQIHIWVEAISLNEIAYLKISFVDILYSGEKMKIIKIGIAPQEKIRERMLAIAKGLIKPKASDPKIWFTSMRSLSQVLSDENRALLDVIRASRPVSVSELADLTGRKQGNLSRTLKTMSHYGLVKMEKNDRYMRPVAQAEGYQIML